MVLKPKSGRVAVDAREPVEPLTSYGAMDRSIIPESHFGIGHPSFFRGRCLNEVCTLPLILSCSAALIRKVGAASANHKAAKTGRRISIPCGVRLADAEVIEIRRAADTRERRDADS